MNTEGIQKEAVRDEIIEWLLEEENPEVRYRTLTEYLKYPKESEEVRQAKAALFMAPVFKNAMNLLKEEKIWPRYDALTSFAEWGLTREELTMDEDVRRLIDDTGFHPMCGEALLLRNLVKLGYGVWDEVKTEIYSALDKIKEDGGFGCISKNKKINDPKLPHKSCARITANYLLLIAEMKQKEMEIPCEEELVHYFLKRNLVFRTDNPQRVVVEGMEDTYYPPDAIKTGIQNLLYAIHILGRGTDKSCKIAYEYLHSKRLEDGRYALGKTKTNPSFKAGKTGKANKWVTLYALMAEEP